MPFGPVGLEQHVVNHIKALSLIIPNSSKEGICLARYPKNIIKLVVQVAVNPLLPLSMNQFQA